jgi:hypothetical protein
MCVAFVVVDDDHGSQGIVVLNERERGENVTKGKLSK